MGVWLFNFTPVPYTPKPRYFYFGEYSEWSKNHRVFSLYMHDCTTTPNNIETSLRTHRKIDNRAK